MPVTGRELTLPYLSHRERPRGRPKRVQGMTEHGVSLEPWVSLATPHGYCPHAVAWFQHLQDGLDVDHLGRETLSRFPVFQDLAA